MNGVEGRPEKSRWSWLRSRWLPTVLAVVPALLTVWAASPPGGYFGMLLVAIGGWLLVGTLWVVATVLAAVGLPRPRARHIRTLWPLLTFPVLLVGMFVLSGSGVISRVMFEVHRPGLERLIAEISAAPDQRLIDQWVGLFTVSSGGHAEVCTTLTIKDAGGLQSTGFAHCLGRPPADDVRGGEGTTYKHVDGPWYTFSFVW